MRSSGGSSASSASIFAEKGTTSACSPLAATADFGYLRLRRETFDDAELAAWAERIGAQPWTDAWVFLKHEEEGRGPQLAARLLEIAGAAS